MTLPICSGQLPSFSSETIKMHIGKSFNLLAKPSKKEKKATLARLVHHSGLPVLANSRLPWATGGVNILNQTQNIKKKNMPNPNWWASNLGSKSSCP